MALEIAFWMSLLLKILTVYFVLVGAFFLKKLKALPPAARLHRFAVLVPARNEEMVIGEIIACLRRLDYPEDLYDIYVIPNNCIDDTEGAARRAGARILHCQGEVRCKGDVLHDALGQLMERGPVYEVFCVFDADNWVDPAYLREMNKAFCAGAKVAKGRSSGKNPWDSWVAGCYSLYFEAMNLFFNKARAACGLSAKLVGTGFAVHRSLLEKMGGWNTSSITEDVEFGAQCAAMGEKVYWVPEARSYDEQPNSFRVSMIQRRRWCSGIVETGLLDMGKLRRGVCKSGKMRALDYMLFLLMPFGQVLSLLPLCATLILSLIEGGVDRLLPMLASLPATYLGGCLAAAAVLLLSRSWDRRMLKAVFTFPIFTVSWLPLHILAVLKRTNQWKEIRHGQTVAEAARTAQPTRTAERDFIMPDM